MSSSFKPVSVFPKYLDQGSTGPAVAVLQVFLVGWLHSLHHQLEMEVSGHFDEPTAKAVKRLQHELNTLPGSGGENHLDEDGNFGPATRRRLKEVYGVDVDSWANTFFQGHTMAFVPGEKEPVRWPPESEITGHSAAVASY